MAKVELLAPAIFGWEGGWSDNEHDNGGKTNMGVTLQTWKSQGYDKDFDGDIDASDLKLITKADVIAVLKKGYWDHWRGDQIRNQSVANILVDWVWCSGSWGIKIPQRMMNLQSDGVVGTITLTTLNACNQANLHQKIKEERIKFVRAIVERDSSQGVFLKGWINRINSFKYKP